MALCQSDHLPLSEPAQAVKEILLELVADSAGQPARRRRGPRRPVISRPYRGKDIPSWRCRPRRRYFCDLWSTCRVTRLGERAWTRSRSRHSSTRWHPRTSPRWSSARTAGRCGWCAGRAARRRSAARVGGRTARAVVGQRPVPRPRDRRADRHRTARAAVRRRAPRPVARRAAVRRSRAGRQGRARRCASSRR